MILHLCLSTFLQQNKVLLMWIMQHVSAGWIHDTIYLSFSNNSVPQLNFLRVTQYVHPDPYMYKYRKSP